MKTFIIKNIEQAALFTDKFKLKLLEQFIDKPRTIKDVAELLELKQTRLYRHVDALFQAGLLKVVKEQAKRGTIEKHYIAIANRFTIDPSIFNPKNSEDNDAVNIIRKIIRETEENIISLVTDPEFNENSTTVIKYSVEGTREEIKMLQDKLNSWLKDCEKISKNNYNDDEKITYKGLIAFYPEEIK